MKDLLIPIKSDTTVLISEIGGSFSGIIIGYKNNTPIGYIQSCDENWYFYTDINYDSGVLYEDSLEDLLDMLIEGGTCTNFKVIEFLNENN